MNITQRARQARGLLVQKIVEHVMFELEVQEVTSHKKCIAATAARMALDASAADVAPLVEALRKLLSALDSWVELTPKTIKSARQALAQWEAGNGVEHPKPVQWLEDVIAQYADEIAAHEATWGNRSFLGDALERDKDHD